MKDDGSGQSEPNPSLQRVLNAAGPQGREKPPCLTQQSESTWLRIQWWNYSVRVASFNSHC